MMGPVRDCVEGLVFLGDHSATQKVVSNKLGRSFSSQTPTIQGLTTRLADRIFRLASLYREGVEPSGPLKGFRALHLFLPSWIYPDATSF